MDALVIFGQYLSQFLLAEAVGLGGGVGWKELGGAQRGGEQGAEGEAGEEGRTGLERPRSDVGVHPMEI